MAVFIKNYLEESKWSSKGQLLATFLSRSNTALSFKKGYTIFASVHPVKVGKGDYSRSRSLWLTLNTIGYGYFKGLII